MASVKKAVQSKGAAKKWLRWYRLMAILFITTIQVNLCCFITASLEISTKFTWIIVIKTLPSTYTIKAISCPPPLILQFFHTGHFYQGYTFLQLVCFWVDITAICNLTSIFAIAELDDLNYLVHGWPDSKWTVYWVAWL